jgi:hypothetical protein
LKAGDKFVVTTRLMNPASGTAQGFDFESFHLNESPLNKLVAKTTDVKATPALTATLPPVIPMWYDQTLVRNLIYTTETGPISFSNKNKC